MANLWQPSINREINTNGNPAGGALLNLWLTGTTTEARYYLDAEGTIIGRNPQQADAAGVFAPIFMDPDIVYRIRCTDATGADIFYDLDPVRGFDESQFTDFADDAAQVATDAAQVAADRVIVEQLSSATQAAALTTKGFYPGARAHVPQGLKSVALTAAGASGTNGNYIVPLSGDNFSVDAYVNVTVAGGAVTAVSVNAPGLYIGNALNAGAVDLSSISGLTGATVTPTGGYLVTSGEYYYTDHATDPAQVSRFQNRANVAVEVDASVDYLNIGLVHGYADDAADSATAAAASAAAVADDLLPLEISESYSRRNVPRERILLDSAKPPSAKISLRFGPGQFSLPTGWVLADGGGDRYTWDSLGALVAVPAGILRNCYAPIRMGGDGRWQGILTEPYGTNACLNPTMAGAVAGSPGSIPTDWSETAGHGLTRTVIAAGIDEGVSYLDIRYAGVTTATSLTLWTGTATEYADEAGSAVPVAVDQIWCASGFARLVASSALGACYAVVGQTGTVDDSNGERPIPLTSRLRRGHALRNLTGSPTGVRMGYRFFFSNGVAVDFTVRLALPQLEPQGYASSPIPVASGRRMSDAISLSGSDLTDMWTNGKLGSMYVEYYEPYQITDGNQRKAVAVFDSTSGGRLAIEGYNNAASLVGVNWNGSSPTPVAILGFYTPSARINTYGPLPENLCKWAARFGTNNTAMCRDNHNILRDAAGTVFTGTAIGSIYAGAERPLILREISLWDTVMTDAEMRRMCRNYENHGIVDEFRRADSIADSANPPYQILGQPPLQGPAWSNLGATGGDLGQATLLREQELRADFTANTVIATYARLQLSSPVRRLGTIVRWRDVPGRANEVASVAVISTANDTAMISSIKTGSVHPTFLLNSANLGYFSAGVPTTETVTYDRCEYDQDYFIGWQVMDNRIIYELPDGRIWEPAATVAAAAFVGRNAITEMFRIAIAGPSNTVSYRTVLADLGG